MIKPQSKKLSLFQMKEASVVRERLRLDEILSARELCVT